MSGSSSDFEFVEPTGKANNIAADAETFAGDAANAVNDAAAAAVPPSPKAATPPVPKAATPKAATPKAPVATPEATRRAAGAPLSSPPGAGSAEGSSAGAPPTLVNEVVTVVTTVYGRVHPYVDWQDPIRTGAAFVAVLAFFILFHVMKFPVPVFIAYVATASLAAAGAIVTLRPYYKVPVPFPPPAVSKDAFDDHSDTVLEGTRAVVDFTIARYTEFRTVLTWEEPLVSVRALAVLFIISNNACWLFCPTFAFVLALLAFALPVAYSKQKATVDAFVTQTVKPVAEKVGATTTSVRDSVKPMHAGLAFGLGLAVVLFMGFMGVWTFLQLSAWVLVALDVLPTLRAKVQ